MIPRFGLATLASRGVVLATTLLALAGCGSSQPSSSPAQTSSGSAATTTAPHPTTATTPTTQTVTPTQTGPATTTSPQSSTPTTTKITFDYTTSDGWNYKGTLVLPQETVRLSSDISSSPPGQAGLIASVAGSDVASTTFYDDNPGRPNGPDISLGPDNVYYYYELPKALEFADLPISVGQCEINNRAGPSPSGVACEPPNGSLSNAGEATGVSQKLVNQVVTIVNHEKPVTVVQFPSCDVFAFAGGRVSSQHGCRIKASGG
jgi:hypothetical protein